MDHHSASGEKSNVRGVDLLFSVSGEESNVHGVDLLFSVSSLLQYIKFWVDGMVVEDVDHVVGKFQSEGQIMAVN